MATRRTAKIARAIRESVSTAILFEIKDPRVKNVTVLDVDVKDDVRSAKIYVSIMGDEKVKSLTMHGLESSRGFLQSRVADRIQTKWTPILKFILDDGVNQSAETLRILNEMKAEKLARDSQFEENEELEDDEVEEVETDDSEEE